MARAHLYRPVLSPSGDLVTGITVRLYEPGTYTLVTVPVYLSATATTPATQPLTFANGIVSVYLDQPKRITLGVKTDTSVEVFYDDVDVLSTSGLPPVTSGDVGKVLTVNAGADGYTLAVPAAPTGGGGGGSNLGAIGIEPFYAPTSVPTQTLPKVGRTVGGDHPFVFDETTYAEAAGILYVVSGYAYDFSASPADNVPYLLRFDIAAGQWLSAVDMPTTVDSPDGLAFESGYAGVIGGVLFFGGGDGDEPDAGTQLWSYDIVSGVFTRLADKTVEIDFGAYAVADGLLWTTDGTAVEVFDPVAGTWSLRADAPGLSLSGERGVQVGRKVFWPGANALLDLDAANDGSGWGVISASGTPGGDIPSTSSSVGVTVLAGKVHALGRDGHWVLDPVSLTYTRDSLATADFSALGGLGDRLVSVGGSSLASVLDADGERAVLLSAGRLVVGTSFASGPGSVAEGLSSHAEGYSSHAEGDYSHAEGHSSHAEDYSSHAEGNYSLAEGNSSHAEGYSSHARGVYSHAEGYYSHAEGYSSHAEGNYSHAEGVSSHAEGYSSHAEGHYSHARGGGKWAEEGDSQYVARQVMAETTDVTPTPLAARYYGQEILCHLNRFVAITGLVAARTTDGTLGAAWQIKAAARIDGAGDVTLLGTPTITLLGADAGAAAWAVTVAAGTSGSRSVRCLVTGAAATNIHWTANLETQEVG